MLTDAGDQVPMIPFGEVVFRRGAVLPEHNAITVLKLGTILGVIVTDKLTGEAHWPLFGVKI